MHTTSILYLPLKHTLTHYTHTHTLVLTLAMEMLGRRKPTLWLRNLETTRSPDGCRYNPQAAGVGILSAVTDPAAACLRVVQAVRSLARGILEVTPSPDLCCRGYCTAATPRCSHRSRPFRAAEFTLSCKLCRRWIGGGPLYMYKGEMGFCKPECRYVYIMQELYKERQRRAGRAPAPGRMRLPGRAKAPWADNDGDEGRSIFFTCVEIFP